MAELMKYTQLFRGPVFVASYPGHAYEELFKLQDMTAEPTVNEIKIADPTRIGLPTYDSVQTVSEIELNGEAVNFSPRAAAIVMYGSTANVPSGTATDEVGIARVGHVIVTDHIPLAVTSVTDDDAVVYELNKDYSLTHAGIRIMDGGDLAIKIAALAPGSQELPLKITYTYPSVDVIKPFIDGQKYYRVVIGQVNEGGNNEKRRMKLFYVKISLNGGLPLNQGTEFGTIPIKITLLADPQIGDSEPAMWQWEVEKK